MPTSSPHFNSSHRHCIISHNHKKGERSTIRYLKEKSHSHNFYYIILLYLFYFIIVVVNSLLCLIYKLNYHRYVGMGKNSICRVHKICSFKYLMEVLKHIPCRIQNWVLDMSPHWFLHISVPLSQKMSTLFFHLLRPKTGAILKSYLSLIIFIQMVR